MRGFLSIFLVASVTVILTFALGAAFHMRVPVSMSVPEQQEVEALSEPTHPLQIAALRAGIYPGSNITVERTLEKGSNYSRQVVSYQSDGLKIYALLTVPNGIAPEGGWPVIIFNHGYIPPKQYKTTERYVAYVDGFAKAGYIVLKPDYRGHGDSEGEPEGAYYSPAYTVDVLNAVASMKKFPGANPEKLGMWGHSMGGHITLRVMVVSRDVKAGVIWGGVVGSYQDMMERWHRRTPWQPSERESNLARRPTRAELIETFGDFESNPDFWKSISPIDHVVDISGPVALHHGLADESVPWEFSQILRDALTAAGKTVQYYTYTGADHNLSGAAFAPAMRRSVEFFDKYVK
ncbi:MAG: alpha/beta fold hydrolase [Patescibacteria group bacterium]